MRQTAAHHREHREVDTHVLKFIDHGLGLVDADCADVTLEQGFEITIVIAVAVIEQTYVLVVGRQRTVLPRREMLVVDYDLGILAKLTGKYLLATGKRVGVGRSLAEKLIQVG